MNRLWTVLLMCAMATGAQEAWAKRLGGGLSFGKQSGNVTQRNTAPASVQAVPPQAPMPSTVTRPTAQTAAAAASSRPWGGVVGGLATGLGLAWLASLLGLGEGFAQVLMLVLLAALVFAVIRLFKGRREPAASRAGLSYQSAGASGNSQFDPATPRGYSPQNVGNDASARPWERSTAGQDTQGTASGGTLIGSALSGSPSWSVPAGFDVESFLKASKTNFVSLQDAWDRSDIPSLRAMMTDVMLEQIKSQLAEREQTSGSTVNKTEVVMLEAQLLGIEELERDYMASVEFSGLIREDVSAGPNPFREIWNITRPKSGAVGWLVAGVQALQ